MTQVRSPEDVTTDWLSSRLREAGHENAEVRSFTQQKVGTGQIGTCIRYELELADADDATPRSLIGKFASDDPTSRQTGVQLGNYLKEVKFYTELQPRLSIRTPKCYAAEIDGMGPDCVLLLEDLAPAEQGDQLAGCSAQIAHAAVQELVGLHAPTWRDATLRDFDWLGQPNDNTIMLGRTLYQMHLAGFLERYGPRLEADEAGIIERVAQSKGAPFELLGDTFSLVHVDYRLDNMLIDSRPSPPQITVVDWQSVTLGNPLSDVAYFLGAGMLPDTRRTVEEGIVRDYHAALLERGIENYDWDRCFSDYRRGSFAGFAVTVIASMMVQQTARGDEMFIAMARRHARHAIDLKAEEFLA